MLKIWPENNDQIIWVCEENEEQFIFAKPPYRLEVVLEKTKTWRWAVYHNEIEIVSMLPPRSKSRDRAIGMAEGLYNAHLQFNKEEPLIRFYKSSINQQDKNEQQV